MGQKTSPTGFRLIIRKNWKSVWFARNQDFGNFLKQDIAIRKFLMAKPCCVGASDITVKRMSDKIDLLSERKVQRLTC